MKKILLTILLIFASLTFAQDKSGISPEGYSLEQNYPNPFNPSTTIEFVIPSDAHVRLEVYDILGNRISMLVDEKMTAGKHEVDFNSANLAHPLPSGMYFYKISANDFTKVKKMTLLK